MAINPNISLQLQPLDVRSAISGAISQSEALRTRDIREQILQQQAQQNQMQQAQQKGAYINQLATGLMELPLDQRASVMAQQLPFLTEIGVNPAEVLKTNLTDDGLKGVLAQTNAFVSQNAGASNFQFGSTQTVQKEDGSLVSVTQVRDPKTGGVRVEEIPIDGQLVTSTGETADERKAREVETAVEKAEKTGAVDIDLAVEKEKALLESRVSTAEALKEIETTAKTQQAFSGKQVQRLDEAIEKGLTAASSLPDINRGLELLSQIDTGGLTARAKAVTDFFGTTSGEIGELNNILAGNVLSGLAAFTGAISEGERDFIAQMETNLTQGTGFNIAQLNRLKNIYQREVNNGLKAAKIAGDEFAIGIFNDSINGDAQGFAGQVQQANQLNVDFVNGL